MLSKLRALSQPPIAVLLFGAAGCLGSQEYKSGKVWPVPDVVDPGTAESAPSDAISLFDGGDLSQWDGAEKWIVEKGEAIPNGGGLTTRQAFGDCQLHVEWAAPSQVESEGQGRGNSGIYLQGLYEIQVLDSYENETYPDGQAGSLYKQSPPLVNACRKPGEWQTFDIIFEAPRFSKSGELKRPGYVTVLHNGVLVQNHTRIEGSTAWDRPPQYAAHAEKLPLHIQDHGNPVRFRNIWIREL